MTSQPDRVMFPIKEFFGMQLEVVEPGHARARLTMGEHHLNPNNVAHGSVYFTMADTSMGGATMSLLGEGWFCTTVDLQIRFIRPVSEGEVTCDTKVLKRGRTVVHLDSSIVDQQGQLLATAQGTFAVFEIA
ncbi:MAG: PaaI family thioesterase [Acidimicrobiales bacterium]